MKHFSQLPDETQAELFFHRPEEFGVNADRELLAVALGATLYIPATRTELGRTVLKRASEGVCSMILDLEDAVADHEADEALERAVDALDDVARAGGTMPLLFVRIRSAEAVSHITEKLTSGIAALAGFVIPKFTSAGGAKFLDEIAVASEWAGKDLFAMPILESRELAHRESRDHELRKITKLLAEHRDRILAVRIGATDMCGTFGIRRDRDVTIYDVRVVGDVIADIVNFFGRFDGTGFVITGPVWEYYGDHERMLRVSPFAEHDSVLFRQKLLSRDLDGLLREIALDRANGMQGKSVIHPSHVSAVHALSAVTHEDYRDALDIIENEAGGVHASGYGNKMNETRPHRGWATETLIRARVFGVTNIGITFVDLLTACVGIERGLRNRIGAHGFSGQPLDFRVAGPWFAAQTEAKKS